MSRCIRCGKPGGMKCEKNEVSVVDTDDYGLYRSGDLYVCIHCGEMQVEGCGGLMGIPHSEEEMRALEEKRRL